MPTPYRANPQLLDPLRREDGGGDAAGGADRQRPLGGEPLVDALCVATLDEASALRPHVRSRMLLLYPVPHAAVPEAVQLGVDLPVMSAADLRAIGDAARRAATTVRKPVTSTARRPDADG